MGRQTAQIGEVLWGQVILPKQILSRVFKLGIWVMEIREVGGIWGQKLRRILPMVHT